VATITKVSSKKMLGDVPEDKRFLCNDGLVLKNLRELETALKKMSADTYHHHVGDSKNDFSSWIKDVVGDDKLADALRNNGSQSEAAKTVAGRISWLKSKMTGK
jgi:hypothetical protein